jgi:hypothetical protein
VSVVHKAAPPDLQGRAHLTHGYPALTATAVNTQVPVISYAHWFSCSMADFMSQNHESLRAFAQTCHLYPTDRLCTVSGHFTTKRVAHMKKQTVQVPDEKMSTADAAKVAGVDQRTVRRWFDDGLVAFDPVPYGSRTLRLVSRLSLEAYLTSRKTE